MFGAILGAVAPALIGGLFGGSAASDQADAISGAGANTAAASKYATDQQMQMFQQQQANQNAKYNQTRSDLSGLFGGNVAAPTSMIMPNQLTADQLRAQLLPQFTRAPNVWDQSTSDRPYLTNLYQQLAGPQVDETGLQAAINAALAKQGQGTAGTAGMSAGSIFGPNAGVNNPQLQTLLAGLRGTSGNQLNLFNSFNPQTMAQDIYQKLTTLGQPQRDIDRANLESRLLNQGILSGTPGTMQIGEQNKAFGQEDLVRQIQAMMTAQAQQQQYLTNATNTATTAGNLETQAYGAPLQAAGIAAGVPVNSPQPIPSGVLGVEGVKAAGEANVNAANITNSFWNSLGQNPALQGGISSLFSNMGNGTLGLSGGVPINTNPGLSGSQGLFSLLNGYGGGV